MSNKKRILQVLEKGGKYGTIDFVKLAHVCDPHKEITRLLQDGHNIQSEWRKTKNGKRYKVWFIATK